MEETTKYSKKLYFIILFVIIVFELISAWSDYSWHERYLSAAGDDWAVFDEQANSADPLFPYTFFRSPVTRLGLIKKSSISSTMGIYTYQLRWANKEIAGSNKSEDFDGYADCVLGKEGSLKDGINIPTSLEDIEWQKPDENHYATTASDKQRLIEVFKKKCDILLGK